MGYGLIPTQQAAPLALEGRLVDLAPREPVQVDLYWHHWEVEPPISREITELIVREARRYLLGSDATGPPDTEPA